MIDISPLRKKNVEEKPPTIQMSVIPRDLDKDRYMGIILECLDDSSVLFIFHNMGRTLLMTSITHYDRNNKITLN